MSPPPNPNQSVEEALFDPQRAIRTLGVRASRRVPASLLLSLLFIPPIAYGLPAIASFWCMAFTRGLHWCGIALRPPGPLDFAGDRLGDFVPAIECFAPNLSQWIGLGVGVIALHALARALPDRMRPLSLWMSLIAVILATSVIYFGAWPAYFPYDFALYYRARAVGTLGLLLLAAPVFGLLYFPIDRSLTRRFAITTGYLAFITISLPIELTLVGLASRAFSAAILPLAFILIGPVLQIVWFASFFSFGLSLIDDATLD